MKCSIIWSFAVCARNFTLFSKGAQNEYFQHFPNHEKMMPNMNFFIAIEISTKIFQYFQNIVYSFFLQCFSWLLNLDFKQVFVTSFPMRLFFENNFSFFIQKCCKAISFLAINQIVYKKYGSKLFLLEVIWGNYILSSTGFFFYTQVCLSFAKKCCKSKVFFRQLLSLAYSACLYKFANKVFE